MVRMLTGALVRCAQGKEEFDWIAGLLAPENQHIQRVNPQAAPAEGLILERVEYGDQFGLCLRKNSRRKPAEHRLGTHISRSLRKSNPS
jgi:tRNA U38,U39,U40 pseudouridine synthase TruA